MSESVLELLQGIFNTFLFIMAVVFSTVLIGNVIERSLAFEEISNSRTIYTKVMSENITYTVKGSSVPDAVCVVLVDDMRVSVNGALLSKDMLYGFMEEEPEAVKAFYELIAADKEYELHYDYGDEKSLEITEVR